MRDAEQGAEAELGHLGGTEDFDIDAEVRDIVVQAYDKAKQVLLDNLDALKRMADALLEYETIDSADIDAIMAGKPITRAKPSVKMPNAQKPPEKKDKKRILDALEGLGKLPEEPNPTQS